MKCSTIYCDIFTERLASLFTCERCTYIHITEADGYHRKANIWDHSADHLSDWLLEEHIFKLWQLFVPECIVSYASVTAKCFLSAS